MTDDRRDPFLSDLLRAMEQARAQTPDEGVSGLRALVLAPWRRAHHALEGAVSPEERGQWIGRSMGARSLFERLGKRLGASGWVIDELLAIAERLAFPVRECVLEIASRHLEAYAPSERLPRAAMLARLSPDGRRAELLREVDAQIAALPDVKDRLDAAADRFDATQEGATGLVHEAIGSLLSRERLPVSAGGLLWRIPEAGWAALSAAEAREIVARWQADSNSFRQRTSPLRCDRLPGWLKEELERSLFDEAAAKPPSDRLDAFAELVAHTGEALRAALSQAFLSATAPVFRESPYAVRTWAPVATVDELRHLQRELLPLAGPWDDDVFLALTERAAELGERDLATAFQQAIHKEESRHHGLVSIALWSGSFSEVEPLLRPYLEEEETSGDLPWVAFALTDPSDAARFAEVVAVAASGTNRLSAWAVVFPRLSETQRQALAPAVSAAVEDALRAPSEESDSSLCEMLPWLSKESVIAIWRARADPDNWQPMEAETTRFFSYDRGYVQPAWLADLVLYLGGEEALISWAQATDQIDVWVRKLTSNAT